MRVINQTCPPGSDWFIPSHLFIQEWHTKIQFMPMVLAVNSEHKQTPISPSIQSQNTNIVIQDQDTKVLTPYQYSYTIFNSTPKGELSPKSEKSILGQYEVLILNHPIYFDLIYHLLNTVWDPISYLSFLPSFQLLTVLSVFSMHLINLSCL